MSNGDSMRHGEAGRDERCGTAELCDIEFERIMQQFWIFGYGSLMWRPGFDYVEAEPALIHGFHRSLCVYSHVHRGTPERPGLVLGLDRGGSCHGIAFRVTEQQWEATLSYLRAREQVTMVYLERTSPIRLIRTGLEVRALTYVVDRHHRQYACRLSSDDIIQHIEFSAGQSGPNIDYVRNTVGHLRAMGIRDAALEHLIEILDAQKSAKAN